MAKIAQDLMVITYNKIQYLYFYFLCLYIGQVVWKMNVSVEINADKVIYTVNVYMWFEIKQ